MDILATVVLLMMSVWTTRAAMCPETDTDLKIWSDRMSWENEVCTCIFYTEVYRIFLQYVL